jgi:Fic family protein
MKTTSSVNEGLTIGEKTVKEHLEAINHAQAIKFIKETANRDIDHRTDIKKIHAMILHGINRQTTSGTIQNHIRHDSRQSVLRRHNLI